MAIYADKDVFGPCRSMVRVKLVHRDSIARQTWVMRYRAALPGKAPWHKAKWLWMPRHYTHRIDPARTMARNRVWLRQHDRIVHLVRPPHLRKPKRMR